MLWNEAEPEGCVCGEAWTRLPLCVECCEDTQGWLEAHEQGWTAKYYQPGYFNSRFTSNKCLRPDFHP